MVQLLPTMLAVYGFRSETNLRKILYVDKTGILNHFVSFSKVSYWDANIRKQFEITNLLMVCCQYSIINYLSTKYMVQSFSLNILPGCMMWMLNVRDFWYTHLQIWSKILPNYFEWWGFFPVIRSLFFSHLSNDYQTYTYLSKLRIWLNDAFKKIYFKFWSFLVCYLDQFFILTKSLILVKKYSQSCSTLKKSSNAWNPVL